MIRFITRESNDTIRGNTVLFSDECPCVNSRCNIRKVHGEGRLEGRAHSLFNQLFQHLREAMGEWDSLTHFRDRRASWCEHRELKGEGMLLNEINLSTKSGNLVRFVILEGCLKKTDEDTTAEKPAKLGRV